MRSQRGRWCSGAVFMSIGTQKWARPLWVQDKEGCFMFDTLCELAGARVFKYPGMLQDLAFPKSGQRAFLHCTLISTLQGQTLARVAVSPLQRREGKELREARAQAL